MLKEWTDASCADGWGGAASGAADIVSCFGFCCFLCFHLFFLSLLLFLVVLFHLPLPP